MQDGVIRTCMVAVGSRHWAHPTAARLINTMARPAPSASSEHLNKIVKGLRAVVPVSSLEAALQRNQLAVWPKTQRVPLAVIRQLVTELAEEQQEPWLLVRAFSHLNYTQTFLAGTYLGNARTLRDAINLSRRYIQQKSDLASLALKQHGGLASILVTANPAAHASEQQLLAVLYAVMRTCQGLGLQQASAALAGLSEEARTACRRLLRLPVADLTGPQRLELRFPALELARALNTPKPNIARLARRERQLIRSSAEHRWSESVQLLMAALLPRGDTRISRCASLLAVAPRTLQRRLTAEQQPFSTLLARVRQQLCLEYLRTEHADDTLALLLGYRQTSQFYRQFRLWFNCSPAQLRSRLISETTMTRDLIHAPQPTALCPVSTPGSDSQRC